ncbi:MAG: AMP-binding protein [Planctomycetota bacterium]|nr:AMP-binding protein [Planctomycetota bacterium]
MSPPDQVRTPEQSPGSPGRLRAACASLVSFVCLSLTRILYRIRVEGARHVPAEGGALIICNHLSYIDPLFVGVASPRRPRFMMFRGFFNVPVIGGFARLMGTIPVSSEDTTAQKRAAIVEVSRLLAKGAVVCIFAEGAISRSGNLMGFARGFERIARRAQVPVIPMALDGLWGSVFSFEGGRALRKWPRLARRTVRVHLGAEMESDAPAWAVRQRIQLLTGEARACAWSGATSLPELFLRSAARHARRLAVVDTTGARLTYRQVLQKALALRAVVERRFAGVERIGIYLPPGAAGAVANLAVSLTGRVTVNLNYSLGPDALADPIERAGLEHVITSPRFLEALGSGSPAGEEATVALEDLAEEVRALDKLCALVGSFLPGALLARLLRPVDDVSRPATILFSSGSSGAPKGVVLTHRNLLANLQALVETVELGKHDRVLGVLPFFHVFGYNVTLWAPLCRGALAVYHARPTDGEVVAGLCAAEQLTILLATPTFYQLWMRRFDRDCLASVRMAITGAEKLQPSVSAAWSEAFGFDLFEGYGCTELSPVVAVNHPDRGEEGSRQRGSAAGTVGRPLPGVAVRIIDRDSGEALAPGQEGSVLVGGPGVMEGYLDDPDLSEEAMRDGWYDTGDIGHLDRDGFLTLTDRRSRFSKIAGEMVPHGRVESALEELARGLHAEGTGAALDPPRLCVTAVSDERRGERLVVLHTPLGFPLERLFEGLLGSALPVLFQPRAGDYFEVESIPQLGSGKTDLAGARSLAESLTG